MWDIKFDNLCMVSHYKLTAVSADMYITLHDDLAFL